MNYAVFLGALLLSTPALAHTGHGGTSGLLAGLLHPVLGLDHLLAMVAVGIWSGLALPRHPWGGAAAFLGAMLAGAGLAFAGITMPAVETLILASVVIFGLLVLVAKPEMPAALTVAALVAIGFFALGHGHAHASEAEGGAIAYVAGFVIATSLLHVAGIGVARGIAGKLVLQRVLGGAIAAAGLLLAAS